MIAPALTLGQAAGDRCLLEVGVHVSGTGSAFRNRRLKDQFHLYSL
jgi:hypothetical protein